MTNALDELLVSWLSLLANKCSTLLLAWILPVVILLITLRKLTKEPTYVLSTRSIGHFVVDEFIYRVVRHLIPQGEERTPWWTFWMHLQKPTAANWSMLKSGPERRTFVAFPPRFSEVFPRVWHHNNPTAAALVHNDTDLLHRRSQLQISLSLSCSSKF